MQLTKHAQERCLQRGIRQEQLEWLLTYGRVGHNKGVCLYFFDREGFQQLLREVAPDLRKTAERSRDAYLVLGQDKVVTTGFRDHRLKAHKPQRRISRDTPQLGAARRIRR